ncbi:ABC transporter permease [Cohnella thermotolerans]|uniref:ABC transporter permease n=1 Tax=Cohnella thermotolerans TaxID=329858 RepID=UPI00040FB345|nr:ABC transporter permease [Cohnella thermotolerans]
MPQGKGVFPYLFKHDFCIHTRRMLYRRWGLVYAAAIMVLLMAAFAIWGGEDQFKPDYLLYACFAFPFVVFGVSFGMLKREWSNGTSDWWLTLPYSRTKLLLSKLAASAAQSFLLLFIYFAALMLLELYNLAINGGDMGAFGTFVSLEAQYLFVVFVTSPFMLSLGLLAGVVGRSKWRPLLPLVWILFGLLGNVFNWLNVSNGDDGKIKSVMLFDGSASFWVWAIIPVAWLLAALLFAGAVNVCKKQLVL